MIADDDRGVAREEGRGAGSGRRIGPVDDDALAHQSFGEGLDLSVAGGVVRREADHGLAQCVPLVVRPEAHVRRGRRCPRSG